MSPVLLLPTLLVRVAKIQSLNLQLCDHDFSVSDFQRIITHRAGSRQSDVNDGSPALQFMVPVAMKKIRGADRNTGGADLLFTGVAACSGWRSSPKFGRRQLQ